MSYHDLGDSGMSADDRRAEADRVLLLIGDQMEKEMHAHEARFIQQVRRPYAQVSTKQLFWLRDLKDKYL
jgi:hypothetical protein